MQFELGRLNRWYNQLVLSALVQLLLLFVVVVVIPLVAWEARKRHRDQQLRANPPRQVVFELCVPRDVVDTNTRMMEVWANVRSMIDPSPEERKEGLGKVTFMFDFQNNGAKLPSLRCFMYCDKEREASIKRTLKSGFRPGELEIRKVKPKDDPRRYYMKLLREREQIEKAQSDESQ